MSANSPKPSLPPALRILEIGPHAEIASAFPIQTRLFWTYYKTPPAEWPHAAFSIRWAWRVWHEARSGKIDLIVAWCSPYSPFNFRELKALVQPPLRPLTNLIRIIGVQWLRLLPAAIP